MQQERDGVITRVLFAILLAMGGSMTIGGIAASPPSPHSVGPALADAQSWGYQLQHLEPSALSQSDVDVLVIDHSRDGSADGRLTPVEIEALKTKPDGSRRVVLSYISIGEAEDYRHYWREEWAEMPPSWLGPENPDWPGNYYVDYWDERWQRLIFGEPEALLDVIIDQGFDGAYLDRVDAYYGHPAPAASEMVSLVAELAEYARARQPSFLIVQQNAEGLLDRPDHLAILDGLAKEDLYFGIDGDGTSNPAATVAGSLRHMKKLQAAGAPVFVVEYGLDALDRETARQAGEREGFVMTFTTRTLDEPAGQG